MNLDNIKSYVPKPEGDYSIYSVLLPLVKVGNSTHILFEKRALHLKRQPGEICLPGGRVEKDEIPRQTSIRETSEELNIEESRIELLGDLDYIVTPFNLIIYPHVGRLKDIDVQSLRFNPDEVDQVFTVPLDFFLNNKPILDYVDVNVSVGSEFPHHLVEQGRDYKWKSGKYPVYFYKYDKWIIWGFTARIVHNFIEIMGE